MPMTKATVLATLPSPQNSFKIVNTTEPVGAFVQDRRAGIMGRFDRQPEMIPVTLTIRGVSHPKTFHYEVLNNAKITPAAMMATVFNAIQGMNEYGEDTTYRLDGDIAVLGYPKLTRERHVRAGRRLERRRPMASPLRSANTSAASSRTHTRRRRSKASS